MVAAIEQGYPQREIANSAYKFQTEVEQGVRGIVGVNVHADDTAPGVPTLYIDEGVADDQVARLADLRRTRDGDRVTRSLDALRETARGRENLMPKLLDCVSAYATLGEMCDAFRDVWGEYEEAPAI